MNPMNKRILHRVPTPIPPGPHLLVAIVLGLALATLLQGTAFADGRIDAYDLNRKTLLFQGKTTMARQGTIVSESTVYTRTDGTVLQTIELDYEMASLKVVRYQLIDPRSGETETVTSSGNRVVLTYRASAKDGEDSETLAWKASHTCTELMAARIQRNLDALIRGETLVMKLLVPSRLGTVEFRAKGEGGTTLSGQPAIVIRAEPAFWLFRIMVAPLRFVYAATPPHRLLEYRGRSSVKTDTGDPIMVRLVYRAAGTD